MKRLLKYSYKRHTIDQYGQKKVKFIEKLDGPGLDLHALDVAKGKKFSVGNKNRNEIYQELARAREFMAQKTSTIKGAKEVRKARELAAFGKTREQMTKGMTKKEKRAFIKNMRETMNETYKQYDQFEEEYANMGMYDKEDGRRRFRDIGTRILQGEDPDAVRRDVEAQATREYEEQISNQTEEEKSLGEFWNELFDKDDNPDNPDNW